MHRRDPPHHPASSRQQQNGRQSPLQRSRQKIHPKQAEPSLVRPPIAANTSKIESGIKSAQVQPQQQQIDMFADSEPDQPINPLSGAVNIQVKVKPQQKDSNHNQTTGQQLTDQAGYCIPIVGTTLNNRYRITGKLGKGVFGIVVKVQDLQNSNTYAVKIIRKNQMTQASGLREHKILSQIHQKYKLKRIMKVYDMFVSQGHICIVCELLSTDLRSFSHKKQPTLADIRLYAIAMMLISHELRTCKILHADIKPDNFLFKSLPQQLPVPKPSMIPSSSFASALTSATMAHERAIIQNMRLADFGTALWIQQYRSNVQQMVARYYRAPQIILGTQIKSKQVYAIDVWAMACSLYQLYTNQFLFNGGSANQMLRIMMETKGKFNIKMINKSENRDKYFDEGYNFMCQYVDKVTKQYKVQKMQVTITAERDLMNLLKKHGREGEQPKDLQNFRDFLQRCLALNPRDRMTPQQAIEHPFLHYQTKLD